MNISVFLPLRAGSTRSIRKNTRPFLSTGESLFQIKMKELLKLVDNCSIVEIIISTNDDEVIEQALPFCSKKIKIIRRPNELCQSSTKVVDLINYVPTIISGNHIFWIHVTSPFLNYEDYKKALDFYSKSVVETSEFDSLMSVNKIQQFIWDDSMKKVINANRDINPWPNTQNLEPLYEINHGFYISSKENYLELNDRIGVSPALFICEGIKKIDIDWEEDFKLAQQLTKKVYND